MKIQIRLINGGIDNKEVESGLDVMDELSKIGVEKVSFDLLESRIALRPNGTYQIFGGLVNYPRLED